MPVGLRERSTGEPEVKLSVICKLCAVPIHKIHPKNQIEKKINLVFIYNHEYIDYTKIIHNFYIHVYTYVYAFTCSSKKNLEIQ
jgi:hypothetical protein